ncbi:MAG: SMC family ATPase [Candidatus Burarchaeum sp.]|nr:SMC family ATPase [Candidatus Burarchaeum sp.]MDO8339710.1 SMC family ATPase [Candidatus Burarchaeum sp.]
MIRRVKLTNWRSHESTELSFGKGTNIIVGIMGAGKSSVLEAISFSLFGTFPALQQKKLKLTDLIMNRPHEKEEARVELEFDADGKSYISARTIGRKKGSGNAELRSDGKLLESGPERVNELVAKLLKIDYDLFTRAIFSEQNRIDYFLTLAPGDRKRKIDELLGIDRFETARSNVRTLVNRFKVESSAVRSALSGANAEKMRSELAGLEKECEELKRRLADGEKELKMLESGRRTNESALSKVEERRNAWLALDRERARLGGQVSKTKEELAEAGKKKPENVDALRDEFKVLKKELASVEKDLLELEARKNKDSGALGAIKAKSENLLETTRRNELLEKELRVLVGLGTVDSLRSEHTAARKALEGLRTKFAEADASICSIESAEHELAKAGALCPVCEAPLESHKKHELSAKRKREIEEAKRLALSIKSELSSKSKALEELEQKLSRAIELHAKIVKLDAEELKKLNSESEMLAAALEKLGVEAEKCRKRRAEIEGSARGLEEKLRLADEMTAKQASLTSMEKKLSETTTGISKLDYNEEEYGKAHASLRKCEGEMRALDANTGNWKMQFTRLASQLSEMGSRLAEIEKQSKNIEKWEKTVEELEIFSNAIVDVQGALRAELIESINSAMNSVWASIYPYGDYAQVRLSASEAGYELELGDGDKWVLAEGVASGGERACACLALRIAFARVLASNLNWLILDEPTHNLDREAIGALATALRDTIPQIVDQVFVITHEDGLREAASGRLYLLDRNKRQNEPTSAEALS